MELGAAGEDAPMVMEPEVMQGDGGHLDCYPYTFSPLLLFAQSDYFDKGYSNYNAVAQFFAPALPDVNMLEGVLYDRKNMLYEDLLTLVTEKRMLVPCCIDAHFTAFQVLGDRTLIYYDPLNSGLELVTGDSYTALAGFLARARPRRTPLQSKQRAVRMPCVRLALWGSAPGSLCGVLFLTQRAAHS
jgi:hypothetical protein